MVSSRVTPFMKTQYVAATNSRTPGPVRVAPDTWVRPVAMPGSGVMASIFSTVHLGQEGVTVIDPGWTGKGREHDYLRDLDDFLRDRGRRLEQVTQVIVTHAHPDHVAAADCLLDATGARFIVGEEEWRSVAAARTGSAGTGEADPYAPWPERLGTPPGLLDDTVHHLQHPQVPPFIPRRRPDVLLADGDLLADHGLEEDLGARAVVTPGHTPGHLCLVNEDAGLFLAADMILPEIHPGIGLGVGQLGGNPVVQYLESLDRIAEFDDLLVIPGHGYVFSGLAARRRETADHVLTRAREVQRILEWNPEISVWRLASQLTWSSGWDGLVDSPMLVSGLRQTMMYRDLVLSGDSAGDDVIRWEQTFA
jgi:glyoxylase-like metal-dependent hydrolase (beta-lactamase superfamily II)